MRAYRFDINNNLFNSSTMSFTKKLYTMRSQMVTGEGLGHNSFAAQKVATQSQNDPPDHSSGLRVLRWSICQIWIPKGIKFAIVPREGLEPSRHEVT